MSLFRTPRRPYAALPLFGQLLADVRADTVPAWVVGIAYHVANGVCFAIAYAMLAAPRGLWAGVAFALVLEAFMLTFYPGWLNVEAIGEFFEHDGARPRRRTARPSVRSLSAWRCDDGAALWEGRPA